MFVGHIHNFRGLAIMLIVLTHVVSVFDWSAHPELLRWLKIAFANTSVFFLFISGYLFQHLIGRFEYGKFLKTKLTNVILPYVLVSIPAVVLFTLVMRRPEIRAGFYDQSLPLQVAEFYVTGSHLAPFWFIPTIAVYFLISPLLRLADRTPGFYWSLPIWILVTVLFSRQANPLINCIHYLSVYLTGMACSHHRQAATEWLSRGWWVLLLPLVLLLWGEYSFTTVTHGWQNTLQKLTLCLIFFELIRRWGAGGDRWLSRAGTLSFGIFFIHSYVISASKLAMAKIGWTPLIGDLPAFFAASVVFILASMLAVTLAKAMTGRYSRQMIGC
jgi:surface polysaccharide O-acyltransferase-like enzyme